MQVESTKKGTLYFVTTAVLARNLYDWTPRFRGAYFFFSAALRYSIIYYYYYYYYNSFSPSISISNNNNVSIANPISVNCLTLMHCAGMYLTIGTLVLPFFQMSCFKEGVWFHCHFVQGPLKRQIYEICVHVSMRT